MPANSSPSSKIELDRVADEPVELVDLIGAVRRRADARIDLPSRGIVSA